MATKDADFAFKEAPDIFSPKDLVSPEGVYLMRKSGFDTIHRSNLVGQPQRLPTLREIWHS